MSSNDPRHFEIAHIKARLAGEEGPDHPRQRLCSFLQKEGHGDKIAYVNEFLEYKGYFGQSFVLRHALDYAFSPQGIAHPIYPDRDFADRAITHAYANTIAREPECDDIVDAFSFALNLSYGRRTVAHRPGAGSPAGDSAPRLGSTPPAGVHQEDQPALPGRLGT